MKRVFIILSFMLVALQSHSQVVLDQIQALYDELSTVKDYSSITRHEDSLTYMIYVDTYEPTTEPIYEMRDGELVKMSEADSLKLEAKKQLSQQRLTIIKERLNELSKQAEEVIYWESTRKTGDVVMYSMTFSEGETLRFEYKPLETFKQHPEFKYQIPKAGGWMIYTIVRKMGESPLQPNSKQ